MPFAIENQKYGFKKEANRGIAEPGPQKFLAVGAEALLDYKSILIADDKIRGSKEPFPSTPGIKGGCRDPSRRRPRGRDHRGPALRGPRQGDYDPARRGQLAHGVPAYL